MGGANITGWHTARGRSLPRPSRCDWCCGGSACPVCLPGSLDRHPVFPAPSSPRPPLTEERGRGQKTTPDLPVHPRVGSGLWSRKGADLGVHFAVRGAVVVHFAVLRAHGVLPREKTCDTHRAAGERRGFIACHTPGTPLGPETRVALPHTAHPTSTTSTTPGSPFP